MTRPELRKLDRIIDSIERFTQAIDDRVAADQIADIGRSLQRIYNSGKLDCELTERS